MSNNPFVVAARRDLPYLLGVLGISSDKTKEMHAQCALCGGGTSLQFGPDKKNSGEWYWHCNKCGEGGEVVAALCLTRYGGRDNWKQAYRQIETDFQSRVPKSYNNNHGYTNGVVPALAHIGRGQLPAPKVIREDPVLDMPRAEAFVNEHHQYLMDNFDALQKWERGISRDVCIKYRLGFIEFGSVQFAPWQKKMDIPAAWVLPITDANGALRAVKIHFEERPHWGSKECPKLLWMPFGTKPVYDKESGSKPVHSYLTMWPHPDTLQAQVVSDFSLDASFWIDRIPDYLKPEWNDLLEMQRMKYAFEQSSLPEDLNPSQNWDVMLRSFDEMKKKIFAAVLKKENENKADDGDTDWSQFIFVCPGELKALACESAGMMATAGTNGEGWIPGNEILSRLTGQKLCLFGDEDPTKRNQSHKEPEKTIKVFSPGKEWCDKWVEALRKISVAKIVIKFGGVKEKS